MEIEKRIEQELLKESERIKKEMAEAAEAMPECIYDEILMKINQNIRNAAPSDETALLILNEFDDCSTLKESAELRDRFQHLIEQRYRQTIARLTESGTETDNKKAVYPY